MCQTGQAFVTNENLNDWIWHYYITDEKEISHIDTLLIYTFWYEFSADFYALSNWFWQHSCHKKLVPGTISFLKYALDSLIKMFEPKLQSYADFIAKYVYQAYSI